MTNYTKRQKELFLVFIAATFLLALSSYSYFLILSPAVEDHQRLKQTAENERDSLFSLRRQAATITETDTTSTLSYQMEVPVKPIEDVVLLQVAEAEIKSDATVKDIGFDKSIFEGLSLPENVENISELHTTVDLEVDTYNDLVRFIKELEDMERIFIIDSIEFDAPEEIIKEDQVGEPILLSVSFSAFYREDLVNLIDEVPKVNAPSGTNKKTPFTNYEYNADGEN